ncbi:hypothetical protein GH733_017234 [Mirounga leonina]|nr:hypothetical protein GH733_017234 [Mirounga leonina]
MKRRAVGIWHCGSCMKTVAGGTWTYNTTSAITYLARKRAKGPEEEKRNGQFSGLATSKPDLLTLFGTEEKVLGCEVKEDSRCTTRSDDPPPPTLTTCVHYVPKASAFLPILYLWLEH